jgi:hypothetical protein
VIFDASVGECLILDCGGDWSIDRKVTEKCLNLGNAHILRVALIVKQNVTPDPLKVGFFWCDKSNV